MWGAGTARTNNGGETKSTDLDASEVLDSATRWLAAEGVSNTGSFPIGEAPQARGVHISGNTCDAPPAPETPIWRPTETRVVSANETKTTTLNRVSGSPVRSRSLIGAYSQLAPVPETAPPPPPRPQRFSAPPRPEQYRQSHVTDERPAATTGASPRIKRKRGRDTASISVVEGVEGLGQRLKRVCLKAKFHRRARQHVSSEDLTMIGSTEVMPAPITPPDNKETQVFNAPPSPFKHTTPTRSLVAAGSVSTNQETGLVSVTSHSLVTGIVDSQGETVKSRMSPTAKRKSPAKPPIHSSQQNIFLQPKVSGKGVLDALESEHEIIFTESTTSEEEFAA